jgi:2-polyprenyl-6-methoxyphenol hydroxylase-like FAD-dependent oxidoreductase
MYSGKLLQKRTPEGSSRFAQFSDRFKLPAATSFASQIRLAQEIMDAGRDCEGAPEFGAIGYGIQFGSNVFHVFERFGLSNEVLKHADTPQTPVMLDALNGEEVTRVPTARASFGERFTYPYIIIHRVDLHSAMIEACQRSELIDLVPDAW